MDISKENAKLEKLLIIYSRTKESKIRQSRELIAWQNAKIEAQQVLINWLYLNEAANQIFNNN